MKPAFYHLWYAQNEQDHRRRILRGCVVLVMSVDPMSAMHCDISTNWDGDPLQQARMAGLAVRKGQEMLAAEYLKIEGEM